MEYPGGFCGARALRAGVFRGGSLAGSPPGMEKPVSPLRPRSGFKSPLFLGIPKALMYFVPQAERQERDAYAASGGILLGLIGVATLFLGIFFQSFWSHIQGISTYTVS